MANNDNFAAACNTIMASRWTLLMARLFGQKVIGIDEWGGKRTIVTGYRWRGVLYMTHMHHSGDERGSA